MSDSKQLLFKGIKYAVGAIPLMFLGPIIIHNAFMNKHTWIHYIVLGVGIIICITSVYLLFKGIQIIMKSLFD
jgi:inner membrane protein involved in colicin E2 resistance